MEITNLNLNEITKDRIKKHEGLVLKMYDDPIHGDAAPTIFYGLLCTNDDRWQKGIEYTIEDAEKVFEEDYEICKSAGDRFIGNIEVPAIVRSIVYEVAFNIGETRLRLFKKMQQGIKDQDFEKAGLELEDSKLYRTLTSRYEPLVKLMKGAING